MNQQEFAKFAETHSREQLVAEIKRMASRMAEGAERLLQHAQRAETEAVPADVANQAVWAMNEAENVLRNLNFSSLARQIGAYASVTTTPSQTGE